MTDTHDASTCDAFPLAVGLAQVQARLERIEAIASDLADALAELLESGEPAERALAAHTAYLIG